MMILRRPWGKRVTWNEFVGVIFRDGLERNWSMVMRGFDE
jgi:hypothetical protein